VYYAAEEENFRHKLLLWIYNYPFGCWISSPHPLLRRRLPDRGRPIGRENVHFFNE
jgi:hypothetical protein